MLKALTLDSLQAKSYLLKREVWNKIQSGEEGGGGGCKHIHVPDPTYLQCPSLVVFGVKPRS